MGAAYLPKRVRSGGQDWRNWLWRLVEELLWSWWRNCFGVGGLVEALRVRSLSAIVPVLSATKNHSRSVPGLAAASGALGRTPLGSGPHSFRTARSAAGELLFFAGGAGLTSAPLLICNSALTADGARSSSSAMGASSSAAARAAYDGVPAVEAVDPPVTGVSTAINSDSSVSGAPRGTVNFGGGGTWFFVLPFPFLCLLCRPCLLVLVLDLGHPVCSSLPPCPSLCPCLCLFQPSIFPKLWRRAPRRLGLEKTEAGVPEFCRCRRTLPDRQSLPGSCSRRP